MTVDRFSGAIPILNVKDLAASIKYYGEKLGFDKYWDWGEPAEFACVGRGEAQVFLEQSSQQQPDVWVSIFLDDVDALYAEYQVRGAHIVEPPRFYPWGSRELLVEDLDGHRFRMTARSKQPKIKPDLPFYDGLARDVVAVYQSGDPAAMQHINDYTRAYS